MPDIELTDRQTKLTDFRFGIIADLVYTHAQGPELARLIAQKAARTYQIPFSRRTSITGSCIRKWLAAFRRGGREALAPKIRKDCGVSRVLTDKDKEALLKVLQEKPQLCASVAVKLLQREGAMTKNVSKSALSRFVVAQGVTRGDRLREKAPDQVLRYDFDHPLECVQVDAMHSFQVPGPDGKLSKVILIAFIDDATRRIVYAKMVFSENSLEFERGILHVLRAHGQIRRLYTDNGSTFVSDQTQRILDTLGIPLIHSRPGKPRGRGKIERFFRTVRTQFEAALNPASIQSIHDYDLRFRTWLESEYHRTGHSGLGGQSPLEAWLAGTRHIYHIPQTVNLDEAFRHEETRVVARDATVSIDGQLYEVPAVLCGRKVKVTTNPLDDILQVRVFFEGHDYGSARRLDKGANAHTRRIMAPQESSQAALRSSAAIGGQP